MRGLPPRIVPWTSIDEWSFVRDGLFSPADEAMQEFSLEIVRIWLLKGRVPTAVEATANLVKVARLDKSQNWELSDDTVIRLAYAAAITRFVNETVDPKQEGTMAVPITRLAEQVGLPRVLVDLRHESVHDRLPALGSFRYALDQSLSWLWKSYWLPQSTHDELLTDRIRFALQKLSAALKTSAQESHVGKLASKYFVEIDYLYTSPQVVAIICELALCEQFVEEPDLLMAVGEMYADGTGELFSSALVEALLRLPLVERSYTSGKTALARVLSGERNSADRALISALRAIVTRPSVRALNLAEYIQSVKPVSNQGLAQLFLAIRGRLSNSLPIAPYEGIKTIEDVLKAREDAPTADGWALASNWRPCPLGCTPTFNPSHDFMSLWTA